MSDAVTRVVRTRGALAQAYAQVAPGAQRAVVLTMGALHEGHQQLMRVARERVGTHGHVTVTIFVNPLQFSANEDLARYPRTLERDVQLCAELGVDLVFAPEAGQVYPAGSPQVTVDPGALGTLLEGTVRPGHFRGVLTVVHKLLALTGAEYAMFGEKDYQQLVLIRQMVKDLELATEIVAVPTVREADGLARSSRNAYLDAEARAQAAVLPQALRAGRQAANLGASAVEIREQALQVLVAGLGQDAVDYVLVSAPDLGTAPDRGRARLLLAARVAEVRLLDNCAVELQGSA